MKADPKPLEQWQIDDADRLKALFDKREPKISQSDFGSQFELGTQGMVSQYLLARRPLNIKAATAFARGLGVSVADFSPHIAAQINEASLAAGEIPGVRAVTDDDDHAPASVSIRMVSMHVQAGIDDVNLEPIRGDDAAHHVPRQWLEENDLNPASLVAVKIKGESMQPLMFEGDIAVVNTTDKARKNGGVFAMNYNGQAVIKRLKYERREWYLTSENPEFKPAPCHGADCIVIGRVVHFTPKNFRDRL
jgi:hypothetical protein